jgi:hypothetical protein
LNPHTFTWLPGRGTPWLSALSPWDLALLVVVTVLGTVLAYITDPKWKAFLLGLPLPFTVANLSLAQQVGPSHVLGMVVLLLFTNLVRWLHYSARVPIVPAIALSAGVYIGAGSLLNRFVPRSAAVFWIVLGLSLSAGILLLAVLPHRRETAHRSPLPVPVKIAAIAGVVALIVVLKQVLGGFMTMFPMVGTIAAYEGRHSLWTIGRQIPILIVTAGPMMAVMWVAQQWLSASIPLSLAAGWGAFLAIMIPLTIVQMRGAAAAFT